MQTKQFHLWINSYKNSALLLNERRLVILSGKAAWALSLLTNFVADITVGFPDETQRNGDVYLARKCLIYGDSSLFPANVPLKRFRDKLGSESDCIIFADSKFNIDALAALSGTLKAGGILFIIMPELDKQIKQSRFVKRFFKLLAMIPEHAQINEFFENPLLPAIPNKRVVIGDQINNEENLAYACLTIEQVEAVNAIEKVVSGHRKRPLVLTADRGRGKSSALAIACAQLLLQGKEGNQQRIIVSAPDTQSLSVFFQQLAISLPDAIHQSNYCTHHHGTVEYIAIDQVIKNKPTASLLLIDEAAGIPVYLLEQLLNRYHRMVFSSTVHGYEGAGRGFTLKFQKILNKECPNWRALHLNKPIRWRAGDPLEKLIFDTCLLNSELTSIDSGSCPAKHYSLDLSALSFRVIKVQILMADEDLLRQIFSILVTAHYQTKPSDVKLMLDNPKVLLVCLVEPEENKVLAVALLLSEGVTVNESSSDMNEINVDDVEAVLHAKRRLKDQFLPQSLLSHCGFEQAFNYSYLRIMRIAVHPQCQQQGVGQSLLNHVEKLASEQKIDFIGASFGVNAPLLSFWLHAGMQVTRIGFTKDKASGEHSVMVLRGLNLIATSQLQQLNDEFYRSFDYLLSDEYKALNAELIVLLLKQQDKSKLTRITALDLANVKAFAEGQRLYSNCAYSLYLWFKHLLVTQSNFASNITSEEIQLVCINRLLQKHSIEQVCQCYGYQGKNKLESALKDYVKQQLTIK